MWAQYLILSLHLFIIIFSSSCCTFQSWSPKVVFMWKPNCQLYHIFVFLNSHGCVNFRSILINCQLREVALICFYFLKGLFWVIWFLLTCLVRFSISLFYQLHGIVHPPSLWCQYLQCLLKYEIHLFLISGERIAHCAILSCEMNK